jgi:hypothetical protein
MYRWILIAHSGWRWIVIGLGGVVMLSAARALLAGKGWDANAARLARLFGISLDVQVLMGASLFLLFSPLTNVALSAVSERVPVESQLHYFAVVHPLIMLAAFIAVHVTSVLVKRRPEAMRARWALIGYGVTWLVMMAGMPWWRPWVRI